MGQHLNKQFNDENKNWFGVIQEKGLNSPKFYPPDRTLLYSLHTFVKNHEIVNIEHFSKIGQYNNSSLSS